MSKKRQPVRYNLDTKDIKRLPFEEIKAILRGADELIATGGRNLLAKILKGSKDKKLLSHGLDQSPVYGFYKGLRIEEITARIDWLIKNDYLKIEYSGRLPMIVYTERGWEIERDTYSDELLEKLRSLIPGGDFSYINELKDRNRGMILLLLYKIKASGGKGFIPFLEAWREIDYRKVKEVISDLFFLPVIYLYVTKAAAARAKTTEAYRGQLSSSFSTGPMFLPIKPFFRPIYFFLGDKKVFTVPG